MIQELEQLEVIFQLRAAYKSNSQCYTLCPSGAQVWQNVEAVACRGSRVIQWLTQEEWGFHLGWKRGAESGELKVKNRWIHSTGCNMQIWDEISSDLPSITLAHMVWGCKEVMAPPAPVEHCWLQGGFKCAQKFLCQGLPSDWSQSGTCQFAEPKPPRFSGFGDPELWKE